MKNFNNKKSVAERGGLMIEALAMLGLIAVVTPTMYKKSAERTMEVEDINTATTIRTIMGAAEAYMASNYTDIMRVMEEEEHQHQDGDKTIGVLDVPESELLPYLPYKYTANNALYNYKTPTVRIVRSGDNLTAFALFPAKVEDGIGQERTVRIASLIGSNGGYVSKDATTNDITAHGVGGIWNLNKDQYENVFQKNDGSSALDANNYSIMVSSADVVNSSTGAGGGGDHPEFLLRYQKEGEEWRNAMRTDLYMGQGPAKDNDGSMVHDDLSSIRNINSLIVGTTNTETENDQYLRKFGSETDKVDETNRKLSKENDAYGLYIRGSGSQGEGAGNVYITGTLLAAGNRLWASNNDLHYTGTNLTFDGTNFKLGKNDADNYMIEGHAEKSKSTLDIMNNKIMVAENPNEAKITSKVDGQAKKYASEFSEKLNPDVFVAGKKSTDNDVEAPKYSDGNTPDFGVDVNADMVVEGVLAAGQLDVNKIRTSSISVGSANIDDAYKWMDVDDTGVHIHEPKDDFSAAKPGTQAEFKSGFIALRAGAGDETDDNSISNHKAQIVLDEANGILAKTNNLDLQLQNSKVGIEMPAVSDNNPGVVNIGNISNNGEVSLSTEAKHEVNIGQGGNLNVMNGNLHVTGATGSGANSSIEPLFSVLGNTGKESGETDDLDNDGGTRYEILGHGDTVFTDRKDNARYLSMSTGQDSDAAVNIMRGNATNDDNTAKGVIYVDMDRSDATAHFENTEGNDYVIHAYTNTVKAVDGRNVVDQRQAVEVDDVAFERKVGAGSIYIRKGLIDIVPDASQVGNAYSGSGNNQMLQTDSGFVHNSLNAEDGRGVIRASRLVANNVDVSGEPIKVPDFYHKDYAGNESGLFDAYNGSNRNRYDTYMVNPAYTSVMNDIKLVSRGGARLSDILPTFITKGIYTAVNGAPELAYREPGQYNKSQGKAKGGINLNAAGAVYLVKNPNNGNKCPDGAEVCLNIARDYSSDGQLGVHEPASPVIGSIPAPQCPPGYMKVIQITPATIRMAEAGRFRDVLETDQTFGGMKINVDDFANPSLDYDLVYDSSGSYTGEVKELMNKMNTKNTAKKMYDLYTKADAYGTSENLHDNKDVSTENLQIASEGTLDFEFKNRGVCVEYDSTDPNVCVEYEWNVTPNFAKPNGEKDMMEIKLATIQNYTNPESNGNAEGLNELVGAESGHVEDAREPQTNRLKQRGYTGTFAEAPGGVWRKPEGSVSYINHDANIVNHDLNFDTAYLTYGTTGDNQEAVGANTVAFGNYITSQHRHKVEGVKYKVHDQIDLSGTNLVVDSIRNVHVSGKDGQNVYVLTMPKGGMEPLTFQKSTWLKTNAIKLYWEDTTPNNSYESDHPYLGGWAILMGFIYPESAYKPVLEALDFGDTYNKLTPANYNEGSESWDQTSATFYWNIFPVERNSLEAYISTYCYFEETDGSGRYNRNPGEFPMVDRINTYMEHYEPDGENKKYREMLNDPSMKYNELW